MKHHTIPASDAVEMLDVAQSLQELADILNATDTSDHRVEKAMENLRTFGGEVPEDTYGIFSWDIDSYLIHNGNGYRVYARSDCRVRGCSECNCNCLTCSACRERAGDRLAPYPRAEAE
jgi:hypothetical protein